MFVSLHQLNFDHYPATRQGRKFKSNEGLQGHKTCTTTCKRGITSSVEIWHLTGMKSEPVVLYQFCDHSRFHPSIYRLHCIIYASNLRTPSVMLSFVNYMHIHKDWNCQNIKKANTCGLLMQFESNKLYILYLKIYNEPNL